MPSTSFNGNGSTAEGPKLRNSCHACASSKLKCTKEKPTCSRCAKRGITCEYVVAKPGGRKPNNRSNVSTETRRGDPPVAVTNSNDNIMHMPWQAGWFSPSSTNNDLLHLHGAITPQKSTTPGSSDIWAEFFGSMEHTLSTASTDTDPDIDDFFSSPMSFCLPETGEINMFDPVNLFNTTLDSSSNVSDALFDTFPASEDAISELLTLSSPCSISNGFASATRDTHHVYQQEASATELPCSCLVQALGLMKQLSSSPSNACMTIASQFLDNATPAPAIQTVIAQNEATIEAVGRMLKCSCSQDGYLLAVMSLIIFKVLGWYATAASKTTHSPSRSRQSSNSSELGLPNNATVVGNYCLDGEDSVRMASQLVLSELHRVRRLVDQLSSKLKVQAAKKGRGGTETPDSVESDSEMTLPLSAGMYDQLDADLRKRLKALSWSILEGLRKL